MPHKVMLGKVLVQVSILTGFIRHNVGAGLDVRLDNRKQVRSLGPVHMKDRKPPPRCTSVRMACLWA